MNDHEETIAQTFDSLHIGCCNDTVLSSGTETVETGTTTAGWYQNTCAHRLPCGYCRILMSMCPNNFNTVVTPTWTITSAGTTAKESWNELQMRR